MTNEDMDLTKAFSDIIDRNISDKDALIFEEAVRHANLARKIPIEDTKWIPIKSNEAVTLEFDTMYPSLPLNYKIAIMDINNVISENIVRLDSNNNLAHGVRVTNITPNSVVIESGKYIIGKSTKGYFRFVLY